MLYAIAGTGCLRLDAELEPLAEETVVWLEPGDRYEPEAGPGGIELLHVSTSGRIAPRTPGEAHPNRSLSQSASSGR